jgi:hypothetical protein
LEELPVLLEKLPVSLEELPVPPGKFALYGPVFILKTSDLQKKRRLLKKMAGNS